MSLQYFPSPANANVNTTPQSAFDAADVVYWVSGGGTGDGSSFGSPTTFTGALDAADALSGNERVVIALIGDIPAEEWLGSLYNFSNGISSLYFVSANDLTITAGGVAVGSPQASRANLCAAIQLTGRPTAGTGQWDLSTEIAAIESRGSWSSVGLFSVFYQYTPFANVAKRIPVSGLGTAVGEDGFLMNAAKREAFRSTEYQVVLPSVASGDFASSTFCWYSSGSSVFIKAASELDESAEGLWALVQNSGSSPFLSFNGVEDYGFIGVQVSGLAGTNGKRFVSLFDAETVLLQDNLMEGSPGDDGFAVVQGDGGPSTGLTVNRHQAFGVSDDGGLWTMKPDGADAYEYVLAQDLVTHRSWRWKYHPSASVSGDAGTLTQGDAAFGKAHVGDVDSAVVRRGICFEHIATVGARLGQYNASSPPSDWTDPTTHVSCFEDIYCDRMTNHSGSNAIDVLWNRVVNKETQASQQIAPIGKNNGAATRVYLLNCVLGGSASRGLVGLYQGSSIIADGCDFVTTTRLAGVSSDFSGEFRIRNCRLLGADGSITFSGDIVTNADPPDTDNIFGIDGTTKGFGFGANAITIDFRNPDDPTDNSFADFQNTYSITGPTALQTLSLDSSWDVADLETPEITAWVGAGEAAPATPSLKINGRLDDGSLGAFGFSTTTGGSSLRLGLVLGLVL